jgi:protein-disulfide isomerase
VFFSLLASRGIRVAFGSKGTHLLLPSQASCLKSCAFFVGVCLFIVACEGCRSRPDAPAAILTPQLKRNIELVVRDHMSVPATWAIVPENPMPSSIPGYNDEDVLFEDGNHQQIVRFLLSTDNQRLARLSNFSLNDIPSTNILTAGRPIRGPKDAPVEMIDFDDLQCPFCERLNAQVLPGVLIQYKGLVKVVYKDFPLTSIHPWAIHAAIDANCLAAQNGTAYWSYVDAVHAQNGQITGTGQNIPASLRVLDALAQQKGHVNGLDLDILSACIAKQDQTGILESIQEGKDLGVNSTPTMFIAGERLAGLPSDSMLRAAINRAIKAKGLVPPR